ncbi:MAG: MFS transporter [Acutalibacteraceae bacterium]|nr:MFS transporter [Acutalibacteraceae bacterium]
MGKSNLKEKVSTTWNNVVLHWKTPALGKYVSYKEIIAYGVGGMGVQFVMFFCSLIALSATSFLVGNTIGIKPMHLQYMAVASTIIGFGITIGRSYIIDSARFKSGKFRPWLAITGIPTVIIAVVFVWLPYETMSYMQKAIAVFLCYNLLQCFYPFFQQAYTDLANVISPNSHERTDIVSVSSIIYSMAPSLTGLFVPMLSTLTGGLNSITTYRIIHPIVAIVGLLLSYIAYAGTRERIIVAESHVTQFKFSDAFRAVAKNKYFWITSLAGWLGFLEGAVDVIVGWTFIYAYPDRMGLYGVATTLIGNAALWAMLICPIAIRVLGKRNLLIWCNVTNVVLIGLLYPLYNNIPALIILYYLNRFVNSFAIVYTPGINADMRDYQQYFTGERIDGMFGAVGIIGSFIGMFTGMVLPTIYQMLGLEDNYDVLEVASFREDMFDVLIIAAAIGAALNFVPYLFYDLTETKQRGIVKVLKIRAMFEDYGNGILRDESIVEAIDIIDEANLLYKDRTLMTTKDDIKKAERLPARTPEEKEFKKNEIKRLKAAYKEFNTQNRGIKKDRINQAKAMPKSTDAEKAARKAEKAARKAAIKAAKKENRELNKLNADISVCDFIIDEMNKYDTLRIKKQVERSRALEAAGYAGIFYYSKEDMAEAKALPKSTHEEREIRSDAITHARALKNARKAMIKFYGSPENIVEPSDDAFKAAEALPDDTFAHQLEKKRTVKKLVNEKSKYIRSVKPLLDARRQLTEKENYAHLDDIRARYADAKANTDAEYEARRVEIERLEEERKADLERRKQERLAKKNGK